MCELCATFGAIVVVTALVLACAGGMLSTLGGRFRELDRIEDRALRRHVRAEALSERWAPAWAWRLLVLIAIIFIIACPLPALIVVMRLLQRGTPPIAALAVLIGFLAGAAVAFVAIRSALRRAVRRAMHAAGFATCVQCGYDCRAVTCNRCPECGRALAVGEYPAVAESTREE